MDANFKGGGKGMLVRDMQRWKRRDRGTYGRKPFPYREEKVIILFRGGKVPRYEAYGHRSDCNFGELLFYFYFMRVWCW